MFKRLEQKWGVSAINLVLILITFALGGSLCGYLAKKLLNLFAIQNDFYWVLVYIIAVTLLWPVCVIFLSLFTGQFAFFKKYLSRIWSRMMRSWGPGQIEGTDWLGDCWLFDFLYLYHPDIKFLYFRVAGHFYSYGDPLTGVNGRDDSVYP